MREESETPEAVLQQHGNRSYAELSATSYATGPTTKSSRRATAASS